jgi:glycine dehydrogenase subunit 2
VAETAALNNSYLVKTAPRQSTIGQIDHDAEGDPQRWAMTWRGYKEKGMDFV